MKKILIVALLVLFPFVCFAHDIEFEWDPNTETDLAGYRLYQSNTSGQYGSTPVAEIAHPSTGKALTNLVDGQYFWVVTAFDMSGNESAYSNEVTWTFEDGDPAAPAIRIKVVVEVTVP